MKGTRTCTCSASFVTVTRGGAMKVSTLRGDGKRRQWCKIQTFAAAETGAGDADGAVMPTWTDLNRRLRASLSKEERDAESPRSIIAKGQGVEFEFQSCTVYMLGWYVRTREELEVGTPPVLSGWISHENLALKPTTTCTRPRSNTL